MNFSPDNFLHHIKQLVTGGGRDSSGRPKVDSGFYRRAENIDLNSILATTAVTATAATLTDSSGGTADTTIAAITNANNVGSADVVPTANAIADLAAQVNNLVADVAALRAQAGLVADETNARVLKIEEGVDSVGNITWAVPRDYDEETDVLTMRILASQLTSSTDDDVELDAEVYIKTAGSALGSDVGPAAPGTVLTTAEQWIEFDFKGLGLARDDVVTIEVITNGLNDTDGEEVLIHAVELAYRSCLVSYDDEDDAEGNALR
jgi:hypothetical protein